MADVDDSSPAVEAPVVPAAAPLDPVAVVVGKRKIDDTDRIHTKRAACVAVGTLSAFNGAEVRGGPAVYSLHSWPLGGFGELAYDIPTELGSEPTRGPEAQTPERCVLLLSAVEAFYLAFGSAPSRLSLVAEVSDEASPEVLSDVQCWTIFCAWDALFPQLYAAYRSLRLAGWNIRDGVKFGVDFTLYEPEGGPRAHATHSVLVMTPGAEGERTWLWLQRHVRLCHQVGKELLLCTVEALDAALEADGGESVALDKPTCVEALEVRTLHVGSWGAGREHAFQSTIPSWEL